MDVVYSHVCMCTYVHVCMQVHLHLGTEVHMRCFPPLSILFYDMRCITQDENQQLRKTNWLESHRIQLSLLPKARVTGMCHHIQLYTGMLGIELMPSHLHSKHVTPEATNPGPRNL